MSGVYQVGRIWGIWASCYDFGEFHILSTYGRLLVLGFCNLGVQDSIGLVRCSFRVLWGSGAED